MGWLRWVGYLKWWVSFAKGPYKRDYILQKRPTVLSKPTNRSHPIPPDAAICTWHEYTYVYVWCVCVSLMVPCKNMIIHTHIQSLHTVYRMAKMHRMPEIAGLFPQKEPLIIGLLCGEWPVKIRHLMQLRHPVTPNATICVQHVYICVCVWRYNLCAACIHTSVCGMHTCVCLWSYNLCVACIHVCICDTTIYVWHVYICVCVWHYNLCAACIHTSCVACIHMCSRVAKTHRMPHLYRSFSAKEPYN